MTEITVHKVDGSTLIVAPITKDATIKYVLMGDWYIELPFTLATEIPIPKGSYVVYQHQKFEIMDNVYPEWQSSTGGYKYVLKFWAQQNHFKRCKVFYGRSLSFATRIANNLDRIANGDIRYAIVPTCVSSEVTFYDTATVRDFAELIIDNIKSFTLSANWEVGEIPAELDILLSPTDARRELISFDGTSCWDAVNTIAETFEIEWWTNVNAITGKVYLNFGTNKHGQVPIDLKQGEIIESIPAKKGDDADYGTRFFVYGGTKNLSPEYRSLNNQGGVKNHISEKRLCIPEKYGDYIDVRPNLTTAEIVEQVVRFDDIYPKSEEEITSIETVDRKYSGGGEDGKDTTFKAFVVTCDNTSYKEENLIEGEALGCVFTSGYLNGREFELSTDKVGDKQFEIVHTTETDGNGGTIIIPNEAMCPQIGDTFILTGISLPAESVAKAEEELLQKGLEYAEKNSNDTDVYDCPTNPVYCQEHDCNFDIGRAVNLYSSRFSNGVRMSRIQGYTKKLYNEYIATYTIGDNSTYSLINAVAKQIASSEVSSKEYADKIVGESKRQSNRKYIDAKQTAQALAQANLEYFSESINPVAVQTMQLLVGSDALQFELVFNEGGSIYYSVATEELVVSDATLNHYTVSNNGIEPTITYSEEAVKGVWNVQVGNFNPRLEDATKYYWLYIKALKGSNTAQYLLSETAYPLNGEDGYNYFLVGLLNAEDSNGNRSWTKMYGFTEITPGRITTEKIQSADGNTWINLKDGDASFAGGQLSWDKDGNAKIQGLTAKKIKVERSELKDVTIQGSVSSPFVKFIPAKFIVYDNFNTEYANFVRDSSKDVSNVHSRQFYYAWTCQDWDETIYTRDTIIDFDTDLLRLTVFPSTIVYESKIEEYSVYEFNANTLIGDGFSGKHDNIYFTTDTQVMDNDFDWSESINGRSIRILADGCTVDIEGGAEKYFFRNGEFQLDLTISNEVVELLGYVTEDGYYCWIEMARVPVIWKKV